MKKKAAESQPTTTIDEYISRFPKSTQVILEKVRSTIREAAPEAQEAIKYDIPTFVLNGNLVHFAAYEKHLGFYPTPSGIERFKQDLAEYKFAKGSVQFPLDSPIPCALIKKMVKFRVQENTAKRAPKK